MISRRAMLVVATLGALLASGRGTLAADAGVDDARRARVVATVGAGDRARTVTVGELEDRIAAMPSFQRASFGSTADAVRRTFLQQVPVREALLSLGAEAADLAQKPPVDFALERALSTATVRAVRAAAGPAAAIPMADVQAYYDENRARYDVPERYLVWRILCPTREEAQTVLDAALASPTPKTFTQLARDHSKDKATSLRAGNLGFIGADGASNEPGVRVDPAVFRAAQGVRDGEIVHAPVVEGAYFSVVWRRGTAAATKRSVQDAAAQIRDTLRRARIKDETDRVVSRLRASRLHDLDQELLDQIDIPVEGAAPADVVRPLDAAR